MIPFAAIERVEVLRDGASSLYGTDAIAGVINFITRKDYRGGTITVGVDAPQHPGGGQLGQLGFGFGDLDKDGINVFGFVDFGKHSRITAHAAPVQHSAIPGGLFAHAVPRQLLPGRCTVGNPSAPDLQQCAT